MDQNQSTNINLAPANTFQDFGLHDFITESNFDQFLELIGGDETSAAAAPVAADYGGGYVHVGAVGQELMIGDDEVDRLLSVEIESQFDEPGMVMVMDPQLMSAADLFAFGHVDNVVGQCVDDQINHYMGNDFQPGIDTLGFHDEDQEDDDEEEDNFHDGSVSSGTTTTSKKGKSDRSRTLISERRRRGRMKDNLYALRALVPNITKMDKASIVGDAVLYVQNLQVKAKLLKAEIAELEASAARQGLNGKPSQKKSHVAITTDNIFTPVARYILEMDAFQVGKGEFYIKMVSNKGEEIATCLHKAIESLQGGLKVQSSNLSTQLDNYVLNLTLHARDGGGEMNMPSLKLWLSRALTGQGFILKLSP